MLFMNFGHKWGLSNTLGWGSCRFSCGSYAGGCSCTSSCRYDGNCCHDYNGMMLKSCLWLLVFGKAHIVYANVHPYLSFSQIIAREQHTNLVQPQVFLS
jgi:hypothetical protein